MSNEVFGIDDHCREISDLMLSRSHFYLKERFKHINLPRINEWPEPHLSKS